MLKLLVRIRFYLYPLSVSFILLLLFLITCGGSPKEVYELPEFLPSEEMVKETLSSDSHLALLREKAKTMGLTLEEWKESEKSVVTDKDINFYWPTEKKKLISSIQDTDAIDRLRDSIRIRIVWSRIFHQTGITLQQKPVSFPGKSFLSKLNTDHSPKFGDQNAKWVIVEWSDYLCGFCRKTFPHTKHLLTKYKSQIHYIHKDFPLDGETDESLIPLSISHCLWEKDPKQFLGHMEALYSHANQLVKGEKTNLETWNYFSECERLSTNTSYLNIVREDWREAKQFGVHSVPTFWVNGRWIVGALNAETWERVLKETSP
ncbi:thioredoxin domain-containing protein [Leptospira jelokensis]|uniref:thioredoxin domain-containing protein n=1 Tax=Leptospira jelokensis TaxID=2484931 RepID=UPI001FCA471E|nr:thioredoxin domain-containing protein [Leptospira jelokensis]